MTGAKFYIWGSRWRELDISSGAVAGWSRRARFVALRRGRLRVASRRAVLAALRENADGQPSAVGLGPRLSLLRRESSPAPPLVEKGLPSAAPLRGAPGTCRHCCVCCPGHESSPAAPLAEKANAPPLCGAPCTCHHCYVWYPACHNNNVNKICQHSGAAVVTDCLPRRVASEGPSVSAPPVPRPPSCADVTVSPPPPGAVPLDTLLTIHTSGTKRARSDSSVTSDGEERRAGGAVKELTVSAADVAALRGFVARAHGAALARFDADARYRRQLCYALTPLVALPRCAAADRRALAHFAARLGLAPAADGRTDHRHSATDSDHSDTKPTVLHQRKQTNHPQPRTHSTSNGHSKQLKVGTAHVILRKLNDNKHKSNRDASAPHRRTVTPSATSTEESDSADDFQSVRPTIRAVRPASDNRRQSLRHRAAAGRADSAGAGGQHRAAPRRHSLRARAPRVSPRATSSDSERSPRDTSSASDTRPPPRTTHSDAQRDTPRSRRENRLRSATTPTQKNTKESNSESEQIINHKTALKNKALEPSVKNQEKTKSNGTTNGEPSKVVEPHSKSTHNQVLTATVNMTTHTISKRASGGSGKEYSNLEDHAIVAWVSSGARARRVNGNALWRELQPAYRALTGHSRSWHSLRNRYLRYILPALGALRLPPALAQRLRAAAATGALKRRAQGAPRRNSIFDESSAASASARRPAPAPASASAPAPAARDEPTLGRRSRSGALPAASSEDDSEGPKTGSSTRRRLRSPAAHSKRSRKLFNPKLVL